MRTSSLGEALYGVGKMTKIKETAYLAAVVGMFIAVGEQKDGTPKNKNSAKIL